MSEILHLAGMSEKQSEISAVGKKGRSYTPLWRCVLLVPMADRRFATYLQKFKDRQITRGGLFEI